MAEKCPIPGCPYEAKTKGAITQHVNREHGSDPLAAVRNKIGVGAPRPGGAFRTDRPMTVMPSGIPSVDYAIGVGGVPRGTVIEVYGPAASGKTFQALTFSAYAQSLGLRAGYMDAERALQPSFAELVPGLDLEALEYGMPPGEPGDEEPYDGTGEAALEASRQFLATGEFAVWTVDSVAALIPRAEQNLPIGHSQAAAAQARMMRQAFRVLVPVVERTDSVLMFVNHVTAVPGQAYGRDWSRPVASAFDYYASIQLRVRATVSHYNPQGRKIGHHVVVQVDKSKVAAPHAKAEYDLFYYEDTAKIRKGKDSKQFILRDVTPGIDIASSWLGVLKEEGTIAYSGNRYVTVPDGEAIGSEDDCLEQLRDSTSELRQRAERIVYPEQYQPAAA